MSAIEQFWETSSKDCYTPDEFHSMGLDDHTLDWWCQTKYFVRRNGHYEMTKLGKEVRDLMQGNRTWFSRVFDWVLKEVLHFRVVI